jgi:hypothetical protein
MTAKTRSEREEELTGCMLDNRRNLYAIYAVCMGSHPPAWLTDREIIQQILRKEFAPAPAAAHAPAEAVRS